MTVRRALSAAIREDIHQKRDWVLWMKRKNRVRQCGRQATNRSRSMLLAGISESGYRMPAIHADNFRGAV